MCPIFFSSPSPSLKCELHSTAQCLPPRRLWSPEKEGEAKCTGGLQDCGLQPKAASSISPAHCSVQMSSFSNLCCLVGFLGGSAFKESACNVEGVGSIPELGRSPEEGNGYPLQYPGLENSMDCVVHGAAKSWTRLSDFHFTSVSGQGGAVHLCHFEQALILSGPQFLLHNKRERC